MGEDSVENFGHLLPVSVGQGWGTCSLPGVFGLQFPSTPAIANRWQLGQGEKHRFSIPGLDNTEQGGLGV